MCNVVCNIINFQNSCTLIKEWYSIFFVIFGKQKRKPDWQAKQLICVPLANANFYVKGSLGNKNDLGLNIFKAIIHFYIFNFFKFNIQTSSSKRLLTMQNLIPFSLLIIIMTKEYFLIIYLNVHRNC